MKKKFKKKLNKIKVSIPSPQQILSLSSGEIIKSDTLNYKSLVPIKGGLFCDKIFGSSNINSCSCGKLININNENLVCKYCKVEVNSFRARRYRTGFLNLDGFFINTIFFKSAPYFLSLFLNLSLKKIENILYNNYYLVLIPYKELKFNTVLSFENYLYYLKKYNNKFFAETSFDAIKLSINYIDLNHEFKKNKKLLLINKNYYSSSYKRILKKYKLINYLLKNNLSLNNIFFKIFPVLPPDLRPIVKLSDNNLISSDLNELYKRLIIRNNRLKKLKLCCFSNIVINNEKKIVQESINDIICNNKVKNIFSDYNSEKIYKSIIDNLKGKLGIFRHNLLGKRVDFSGRAVIVSAPHLNINECSIPKKMALELFRPFIYNKLIKKKNINIKKAKIEVDNKSKLSFFLLNNIIKNNYILLNRAPTLHRLGMQSFKIKLNNDNVIKLHPLVCSSFNADFDGDQMAAHIPISLKSKNEFKTILLSLNNILLPSNGNISILPTQDIVLGIYYGTKFLENNTFDKIFDNFEDLKYYFNLNYIKLNTKILFRFKIYNDYNNEFNYKIEDTTYGRFLIYNILPKGMLFSDINKVFRKDDLSNLLNIIFYKYGIKEVSIFSNKLMKLGFSFSTQSGISISMDDMLFYEKKQDLIDTAKLLTMYYNIDYLNGLLNFKNRKKKIIDIWDATSSLIFNFTIEKFIKSGDSNSLYRMIDSGSRGSELQIKQICCMRGVMSYKGALLDIPVISSLREGLGILEYFYFSHSSRKTLADTALKTSVAGYLTRRLVEISNNVIINNIDCFTDEGIIFKNLTYKGSILESFYDRILGRVILNDIFRLDKSILYKKNTLIIKDYIEVIKNENINYLKIRSPLTCKLEKGICSLCYGIDLSTNKIINIGVAAGIIAAQSIGEPGTQLTMRTFHTGGALNKESINSSLSSNNNGVIEFSSLNYVINIKNEKIVVSNFGKIFIKDGDNDEVLEIFNIPYSALLLVEDRKNVKPGDVLCKWDINNKLIISDRNGYIRYENLVENLNCVKRFDNTLSKFKLEISKNVINYPIFIKVCKDYYNCDNSLYFSKFNVFPEGVLQYEDHDYINAGDIIYKAFLNTFTLSDITGGLPKVINLFEARIPKKCALLSFFDGCIFFEYKKKYKYIFIKDKNNLNILFKKRFNLNVVFFLTEGTFVNKGDVIINGDFNPHDILKIYGVNGLLDFYLSEIKSIYYSQGVKINDKHIEIILREMLVKVFIIDPVSSNYIKGDIIDKNIIININNNFLIKKLPLIKYDNLLLGITKSSLLSSSFLSAASFQHTTSVLSDAAIFNKIDKLKTIKTDVMLGKSIPIGTGFYDKIFKNRKNINAYFKSTNKKKKKKKIHKK
ncbi:DNA-directed RNA polymerase beta' subunit [Candidatus Nasuia deltocephalinicola]|nr:DNA-directed RNA polymerase beta' subunit [Candidatus Nasuia deltocephalinicola]